MTQKEEGPAGQGEATDVTHLTEIPPFLDRRRNKGRSQSDGEPAGGANDAPTTGCEAAGDEPPPNPLLDAALNYARRGWPVLPLHTSSKGRCSCNSITCKSPGKHPRIKGGFKNATCQEKQIKDWWSKWPAANIGIATGFLSQFVVLDIDPRHGGDVSLAGLQTEHGLIPETLTVQTGGKGTHYYFRAGGLLPSRANVLPGIDFRGEGGYVVASPSTHASGGTYEVVDDAPLAPLPLWLAELIRPPKQERAHAHEGRTEKTFVDNLHVSDRINRLIREGDTAGEYVSRSEALFAVIGAMVRAGLDDAAIGRVILDPQNKVGEKAREKGAAWLQGEIGRAREKPLEPAKTDSAERQQAPSGSTRTAGGDPICLADVEPEDVEWLWYPYIPLGKITSIEGDPGVGKSWLTLSIAAAVTTGGELPGQRLERAGRVLLFTAEDGLADTVRPRLNALGGDPGKLFAVAAPVALDEAGLKRVAGQIEKFKPDLVIFDPLVAYLGDKVNMDKANQVRGVMARLHEVAEQHRCAIMTVRHLSKSGRDKAIYRGLGTIDITAACRSVLLVGLDPENDQRRVLAHAKSNLALMGPSLAYEIFDGRFEWIGEVEVSAEQLCSAPTDEESRSALQEAEEYLEAELSKGPVEAKTVVSGAKAIGIFERTLRRAKKKLEVMSYKEGTKWLWRSAPRDCDRGGDILGSLGNLKDK